MQGLQAEIGHRQIAKSSLQIRVLRFNSGRGLQILPDTIPDTAYAQQRASFLAWSSETLQSILILRRRPIPADTLTFIGLGVGAIFVVWLVFSVLKKVIGLLFLAAVVIGGIYLWNNPAVLHTITVEVGRLVDNWF